MSKPKIKIVLRGILATISGDIEMIKSRLVADSIRVYQKRTRYGNVLKRDTVKEPIYTELNENTIITGIGGIKYCEDLLQFFDVEFDYNIEFDIPTIEKVIPEGLIPRNYQDESVDTILLNRCGMIKLPTSAGKTEIFLIASWSFYNSTKTPVLILVNTLQAESEILLRARDYNIPISRYRDWRENEEDIAIIVTTPKILYNDLVMNSGSPKLEDINYLIIDESHHSECYTYHRILTSLPNVKRAFGFSASPLDSKNKEDYGTFLITSLLGNIIYERHAYEEDIAIHINDPVLICYHYNSELSTNSNDWHELTKILKDESRLKKISDIIELCNSNNLKTITFMTRRESGKLILNNCNNKTLCWYGGGEIIPKDVDYIYTYMYNYYNDLLTNNKEYNYNNLLDIDNIDKDNIYKSFVSIYKKMDRSLLIKLLIYTNCIDNIICTQHANESSDISSLDVAIIQEGRKDRIVIQRAGRALRKSELGRSYLINIMDDNIGILKYHARLRNIAMQKEYKKNINDIYNHEELNYSLNFSKNEGN